MLLIFIAVVLLGTAFAGIAVKIWAKKDGEFAGTCASNNPALANDSGTCSVCGAKSTEQCKN